MSRWSKKGTGRYDLLPLLLLALALGGTSLVLASLNLLLTTTSWGQNLCQDQAQQHRVRPLQEPNAETQIYYQNVWEKHQFLYQKLTEERRRHRRSVNGNRKNKHNNRKSSTVTAAHYEVKLPKEGKQMNADDNGTILHWTEVPRNSTNPVKYDEGRGQFMVNVKGLFYLYCQVHFNEDRSSYIKLDLLLDGNLIFRCLQEFSATAASIREPKLKTCSVSGLVVLRPGNSLHIKTLPKVSLKVEHFLTYFGLFQVH
ncbi:tumor necrosis factor ligand superfamily member 12 [Rhinoderma darwinii]|uniref:tumor necrosis factor ligand superfamily member 12 n=1 Tax=Rhinoderma darwinii TaxID=43563 RepID=UPI003F66596C